MRLCVITVSAANSRGQHEQFVPCPKCKGPPSYAELVQTRSSGSCSSFTSQSSFSVRGLFHCIDFKSAYFFASFVLPTQISTEMHTLSYLTTAWSARARHPFLKPLNEDGNFKLRTYAVCRHKKGASEHTIEHVTSQNFLEPCP